MFLENMSYSLSEATTKGLPNPYNSHSRIHFQTILHKYFENVNKNVVDLKKNFGGYYT